ncbi:DUF6931 family protein [Acidimangrovimonas sediminis]|uniref:DUF6931 family protein n=1 Tax=Acidimangrovimonas sediminis TaxID=2056283 RepID=UPI0011AFCAB5|nr:hypothetical protein [Acidimangrovimonas sediminis]
MNGAALPTTLPFASATEVYAAFPEIAADLTAPCENRPPLDFLAALAASATPEEALTFAAFALERRLAIWWGHECLRQLADRMTPRDLALMELAAAWVAEPGDGTRGAALEAARESEAKTPGVWIALAAGWSSGSMTPADQPAVPVPPHLCPRAINAAVLSALARVDRPGRPAMLARFARMARTLAEGG